MRNMRQDADEEIAAGARDAEFAAGLSEAELQRLGTIARIVEFAPGDCLLTEGRLNDQVYIVSQGVAEVVRDAAARTERIARVGRGSCVGEMSALGGKPVTLSVKALTPIRALAFDCAALQVELAAVPRLGANLALILI